VPYTAISNYGGVMKLKGTVQGSRHGAQSDESAEGTLTGPTGRLLSHSSCAYHSLQMFNEMRFSILIEALLAVL
jgi:hypothetical protein